ncbi:hypothetical protein QRC94_001322 [Vibrio vulnificus]|uniref:hypothetical protein n=1 Tax=Vibrio vulnificus TaxID=672 RepID=UPI0005F19D92|nr:hypothetical protein [Vibrio vulnificus]EGQ7756457.1 hypothetical protein [Vibrio vulnificus]EGQ7760134.1 hypothetical protein [Vibrio vulnificus]EGQ9934185.1 hypothetical protein [Vibrio vulnificus]EJC6743879.1 hypothetical protein [Vibrio vulnificus]EJC6819122.1 hypothetical protein [Vibrio vulnificus]
MTLLDNLIITFYVLFIGFAAWLFRRFARSSSDFIQGGGTMMWWMAGAARNGSQLVLQKKLSPERK